MEFAEYLEAAVDKALSDAAAGTDNGDLEWINKRCRKGVRQNHENLDSLEFLEAYLSGVGIISKDYDVRQRHWEGQMELFRRCDARRVVSDVISIWREWENSKCYLNKRMVNSVIFTAALIAAEGWEVFKAKYLPLPKEPEAETKAVWRDAHWLLDQFPMVGEATAWYLIRNLYGGPFFKPDVHISAIAKYFFGSADAVEALAGAVRQAWPKACRDSRFQPVHLGEVDYILWRHQRSKGIPE